MSIKPVEVGVIVQRMTEVDRAQQARDQRAVLAQQQFGQEMRAEQERRETEIKAPPETAKLSVHADGKREREGGEKEPGKGRERREGSKETEAPVPRHRSPAGPGQNLDIKL